MRFCSRKERMFFLVIDDCSPKDVFSKRTIVAPVFLKTYSEETGAVLASSKNFSKESEGEILATTAVFGKEKASKERIFLKKEEYYELQ